VPGCPPEPIFTPQGCSTIARRSECRARSQPPDPHPSSLSRASATDQQSAPRGAIPRTPRSERPESSIVSPDFHCLVPNSGVKGENEKERPATRRRSHGATKEFGVAGTSPRSSRPVHARPPETSMVFPEIPRHPDRKSGNPPGNPSQTPHRTAVPFVWCPRKSVPAVPDSVQEAVCQRQTVQVGADV